MARASGHGKFQVRYNILRGKNLHLRVNESNNASRYRPIVILLGIGFFFASTLWGSIAMTAMQSGPNFISPSAPQPADWLLPAPRISIDGDIALSNCPWVNGSGTWNDPYVIRNLTINAGRAGPCIRIWNTIKYFQIINCTLTNSGEASSDYAGISLANAGNGTLINNTCYGNYHGIYLQASKNNTVQGNNCTGNLLDGVSLWGSECSNNSVINNVCAGNSRYGLYLWYSGNVIVSSNNYTTNKQGGIYVVGAPNIELSNNLLRSCSILLECSLPQLFSTTFSSDNMVNGRPVMVFMNQTGGSIAAPGAGQIILINCSFTTIEHYIDPGLDLSLCHSANNTISENNFTGGTTGIYLYSSCNNTLVGNNCTGNGYNGIFLNTGCINNMLSDNRCGGNNGSGMRIVTNCINNTLIRNNCSANKMHGIYINYASNNRLINNTYAANLLAGIYLYDEADFHQLTNNSCLFNGASGIVVAGDFNVLTNNTCTMNTASGIEMVWGYNNTITHNECDDNAYAGLSISYSDNNTMTYNTFSSNDDNGIWSAYSSNFTVISNNITDNTNDGLYLCEAKNATIVNNNFTRNTGSGINFGNFDGSIIFRNTFFKNGKSITLDSLSQYSEVCQNWLRKNINNPVSNGHASNNVHDNFLTYMPSSSFTSDKSEIVAGQSIAFTDTTSEGTYPLTYEWNFGDGATSIDQSPSHLFSVVGTFSVTLKVTDADGDTSSCSTTVNVTGSSGSPSPEPDGNPGIASFPLLELLSCIGFGVIMIRSRKTRKQPATPRI